MNGFVRQGANSNDVSDQIEIKSVADTSIGGYVRTRAIVSIHAEPSKPLEGHTDEPDSNVDEYAAKISDILDKMKMWGLDKPNLLISVTGEAKHFQMNKRQRDTFRRGLRKIVLTTGAWIITGGTNYGVSKLVGEAVKECRIVSKKPVIAIGLAPSSEESCLDRNHSHCILVDNDTQHELIPFRAKLEREITKFGTDKNSVNAVYVPIVLLVLNGGPGTLETVHQAIDNNTPIVVLKGSGRAADILAYAYQNAKEEDIQTQDNDGKVQKKRVRRMDDSLTTQVNEMVKKEFGPTEYCVDRIKDCLDKCDLLSVLEMDGKCGVKGMDVVIIQALLKANTVMDQIRVALAWDIIDVAKSDIFTDDKIRLMRGLDDVMFSAMQLNRVDFIELFLDHGVSLREFLTIKRLRALYDKIPPNRLLRTVLNKLKLKEEDLKNLRDVELLIQKLMGYTLGPISTTKAAKDGESDNEEYPKLENPCQQLFIWSILMLYQDMAKLFWARGKDAIAAALVGNRLLQAMKSKTEDTRLAIKIQKYSDEWSDLAAGVLSECHMTDEHKAHYLLDRELTNWGKTTCMLIAVKAHNKEFISQTACQSLLNRVWMGRIAQNNLSWRLAVCLLFPPLILPMLKFLPSADDQDTVKTQTYKPEKIKTEDMTEIRGQTSADSGPKDSLLRDDDEKEESAVVVKKINVAKKFFYFFNAPVTIFLYNVSNVSNEEIVLMIWVFTIFTEEIRQVATKTSNSLATKLQSYIMDTRNIVDIITIVLFIVGMVLRFLPHENTFEAARVFLALDIVTFHFRLLHIFSVHKEIGPKLVMIRGMVRDFLYFLIIPLVIVASFSIASHCILFPNSPLSWNTVVQVIRRPYWNIYGELFLDEIEGDPSCTFDEVVWGSGTYPRCPTNVGRVVVPIMMGVYMLIAHVLLLNLLIAMFSYTFTKIQEETEKHWCLQRYYLIYEYKTRPVLCPPLIIFAHIYLLLKFIVTTSCRSTGNHNPDSDDQKYKNGRELEQWEAVMADAFHEEKELQEVQNMDYKVSETHTTLQDLMNHTDEIQEQLENTEKSLELIASTLQTQNNRIDEIQEQLTQPSVLEKQLENTQKSLEWIMSTLQAQNNSESVRIQSQ